jgi:hypothetical protein
MLPLAIVAIMVIMTGYTEVWELCGLCAQCHSVLVPKPIAESGIIHVGKDFVEGIDVSSEDCKYCGGLDWNNHHDNRSLVSS